MEEREQISVKGDKVNPYKVSNRDERFQKRGRRLWREKVLKVDGCKMSRELSPYILLMSHQG